jgi:hypothetical protein
VNYAWSNGSTDASLSLGNVSTSAILSVNISWEGHSETINYEVFVKGDDTSRIIPSGNYMIRHAATDTYLTCNGLQQPVTFTEGSVDSPQQNQLWYINSSSNRHSLQSLLDSLSLNILGNTSSTVLKPFYFEGAEGIDRYALHSGMGSSARYWSVTENGELSINTQSAVTDFPFELLPVDEASSISSLASSPVHIITYDLQGRIVKGPLKKGIYIQNGCKVVLP